MALLLTGCSAVNDDDTVEERVKVGDRVPVFSVNVTGQSAPFSTASLQGETVIVFFNTSCSDCRRELPRLNRYYLQHRDDKDFQMVAISREEGEESVAAFWQAEDLSIPYSAQTSRKVYELFASSVIPRVYFCSAGIVTKMYVEQLDDSF